MSKYKHSEETKQKMRAGRKGQYVREPEDMTRQGLFIARKKIMMKIMNAICAERNIVAEEEVKRKICGSVMFENFVAEEFVKYLSNKAKNSPEAPRPHLVLSNHEEVVPYGKKDDASEMNVERNNYPSSSA